MTDVVLGMGLLNDKRLNLSPHIKSGILAWH